MKVLSISELLCLTCMELLELRHSLERQLGFLSEKSSEFRDSSDTLDNVRRVLARIEPPSGRPPSP